MKIQAIVPAIIAAILLIAPAPALADMIIVEDEECDALEPCDGRDKPLEIGIGAAAGFYLQNCYDLPPLPPPSAPIEAEMNECALLMEELSEDFAVGVTYPPPAWNFAKSDHSPMDCLGIAEDDPMKNDVTIQIEDGSTNDLSTVAKIYKFDFSGSPGIGSIGWVRITLNNRTFSLLVEPSWTAAELNAAVEQAIDAYFDIDGYTTSPNDLPYWIVDEDGGDIWRVRVMVPEEIGETRVELRDETLPHGGETVCQ